MCIKDLHIDDTQDWLADGDEPYLKVNTVFWRAPFSLDEGVLAGVGKTVHVGDVVQAWEADSPDPDDLIGRATVGSRGGVLDFNGNGAHYRAHYERGAC